MIDLQTGIVPVLTLLVACGSADRPDATPHAEGSGAAASASAAAVSSAPAGEVMKLGMLTAAGARATGAASSIWGSDHSMSDDPSLDAAIRAEKEKQAAANAGLAPSSGSGNGGMASIGEGPATSGSASPGGSKSKAPSLRLGAISVTGKLPPEVIQRVVRQRFDPLRMCLDDGLKTDPGLKGTINLQFVIGKDGSVSGAKTGGDLPSEGVKACVSKVFLGIKFPQPEAGVVMVSYPMTFEPGQPATAGPSAKP